MSTLLNFGVPLGGGSGRGGMLQPKTKQKFRVRATQFGPVNGGLELTQQVVTCGRPQFSQPPVEAHSYNSVSYFPGKAVWEAISMTVRDDVTNVVSSLIGYQLQKQMNFFEQTTPESGADSKFTLFLETLDGGNGDNVLEQWFIEGCFITTANYETFDYGSGDAMTIELSIRYDNATQSGGIMPLNPVIANRPFIG
jgi:hypothetical protein